MVIYTKLLFGLVKTEPLKGLLRKQRWDVPVVAYKHLPCLCQSAPQANRIPERIRDTSRPVEGPELPGNVIGSGDTEGDSLKMSSSPSRFLSSASNGYFLMNSSHSHM